MSIQLLNNKYNYHSYSSLESKRSNKEAHPESNINSKTVFKGKRIKIQKNSVHSNSIESKNVKKNINTTAEGKFCGRLSFKGGLSHKVLTSKPLRKFIELADENMLLFDAAFALAITCGLRPAVIMALPSKNSNKEKNKKAASHSIASGVIGYVFALLVSLPMKKGIAKVAQNPTKYLKQNTINNLHRNTEKPFNGTKEFNTVSNLFTKSSEVILAPFRAAITISLIPIIDKYILNKILKTPSNNNKVQNPAKKCCNYPILTPYSVINFKKNFIRPSSFKSSQGANV